MYFAKILEFSVVSKQNNTCQMLKRSHCPSRVSFFSNCPCLSVNIFVCKFVYIVRTDQNPLGSCQLLVYYIYYDDSKCSRLSGYCGILYIMMTACAAAYWATVVQPSSPCFVQCQTKIIQGRRCHSDMGTLVVYVSPYSYH